MAGPRKFQVVECLEERMKRDGSCFYRGAVIEQGRSDKILEIFCRPEYNSVIEILKTVGKGGRFAGAPFAETSGSGVINCTPKTQVMKKCGDFEVNQEVVGLYTQPPVVSHTQARASPKKRRLSVDGIVKQVTCNPRGLKCIKLGENEGEEDGRRLTVNLWDNVDCEGVAVNDAVQVIAVEVLSDGVLTSSPSTTICSQGSVKKEGVVQAVSEKDDDGIVKLWLEDGSILTAPDFFTEIIDSMELPCTIKYEATLRKEIIDVDIVV